MYRDSFAKRITNPRQTANIFSLLSFFYTIKLFTKGYIKGIETEDIYEIFPSLRSKNLGDDLEQQWQKDNSISRILWLSIWKEFVFLGLIRFTCTIVMTIWSPEALSKLISYFSPSQTTLTKQDAIFYAFLVIGLSIVHMVVIKNVGLLMQYLGIRLKAAVSSLLYRKTLKLSQESLLKITSGKIITVITKDTDGFELFLNCVIQICIAVVQTFVICYLIYGRIRIASFAGIAFFFVVLPVQMVIGKKAYDYRLKCNRKSDERLELLREVLSAIKVIKMYTWETFFEDRIDNARRIELKKLHNLFYTRVWITLIANLSSKVAFFIFLMTYIWMGNDANAETIYYILSCCNNLEQSLSNEIPSSCSVIATVYATLQRIEDILEAEELSFSQSNFTINEGLTIVTGHTGSGKTTFLKTVIQGEVRRISYASQEPWLFPSTIKNNILFGESYNQIRYYEILDLCCLDYDLKLLPDGDGTIVGDSGVNLSKGQQARVNLARAIYKDSDIYLLDNCLAALDRRVSDNIFRKCILQFLSKKQCIFVTNNSDYIQHGTKVIELNGGTIKPVENPQLKVALLETCALEDEDEEKKSPMEQKTLYHETKRSGRVPLKYYHTYLIQGGGVFAFSLVIAWFVASHSTTSVSDKVFSQWVTLEQQNHTNHDQKHYKLGIYATTAIASIILTLIKSFAFYHFTRKACVSIHRAMVRNVVKSTMKFLDGTFMGNILTRFTKDCLTIDETFPFVLMDCLTMIFTVFGGIILLTTVDYFFLLESLLLLVFACALKEFLQPAQRNLERLHVIVKSPINGHLNSTIEGLTTIRASQAQKIVTDEFDKHQDVAISALCMVITHFNAFGIFLRSICIVFISLIITQVLVFHLDSNVGDVGLVITQAFVITGIITSGIINIADCENLMISIERMLEFTELKEEDNSGKILIGWPKSGQVTFSDVSLSYSDAKKKILRDVNFGLSPREKLGVVGRTGAGKSSIISALFRLYDITGIITIDGIDIQNVSLKWLRSNISVIPQDPYIFSGTVRENLDPLTMYRDDEMWKILDELKLTHVIKDLDAKIDKDASISTGQKQLLCLARAILRKTKIVVLDEATANVDHETETLINESVHRHFDNFTLIIVTHKLSSTINCDKILVLQNGKVNLVENNDSFVNNLIK